MRNPADVMQATFDAFTAALSTRPSFRMPRRQSMQMGGVTYECEEMIVQGLMTYQGTPGQRITGYQMNTGGMALHSFDVAVHLVRTHPTGDDTAAAPRTDALNRATLVTGDDAAALSDSFWSVMSQDLIASSCDVVYFGGVEFAPPSGGLASAVLQMSVQL